jgi:transposase-like protein
MSRAKPTCLVATPPRAPLWQNVEVRTSRYPNNVIEQDHRAIKRRCASMEGFKLFDTAAVTIAGIELAHRMRKRQFMLNRTSSTREIVAQERMGVGPSMI